MSSTVVQFSNTFRNFKPLHLAYIMHTLTREIAPAYTHENRRSNVGSILPFTSLQENLSSALCTISSNMDVSFKFSSCQGSSAKINTKLCLLALASQEHSQYPRAHPKPHLSTVEADDGRGWRLKKLSSTHAILTDQHTNFLLVIVAFFPSINLRRQAHCYPRVPQAMRHLGLINSHREKHVPFLPSCNSVSKRFCSLHYCPFPFTSVSAFYHRCMIQKSTATRHCVKYSFTILGRARSLFRR